LGHSKSQLRQHCRQLRRNLLPDVREPANQSINSQLIQLFSASIYQNIAVYLAFDGEVDLTQFIQHAHNNNRNIYAPVIDVNNSNKLLNFLQFNREQLEYNDYQILQPKPQCHTIQLNAIDGLIVPVVSFDKQGNRLGMGKGYYDRLLATIKARKLSMTIIGVAYAMQESVVVPTDEWDCILDTIITDKTIS